MIDEIEKGLLREIEDSETNNVLYYDDEAKNKWKPMCCKLCGEYFSRRGIDRHLNQSHGIIRFDWGLREAKLTQHRETKSKVVREILNIIEKYPIQGNVNCNGRLASIDSVMRNEIVERFVFDVKDGGKE